MSTQKDYDYDVFLSYKRNPLIEPWVKNIFFKYFKLWLTDKLLELCGQEPRIFFDQKNIEAGDNWPVDLQNALKTSKVLVAICSPSYFYSQWCKSEWESFAERERVLGITGLRIPVRHNDCENFLSNIAWSDFYGYTFLAKEFYQSIQATIFEKKVEDLAKIVAKAICLAPPFDENWPVLEIPPIPPNIPMLRL